MNKRLIPKGGITIYPNIRYVDGIDVTPSFRDESKKFFETDEEYRKLIEFRKYLRLDGLTAGREFIVYVFKGEEKLGIYQYREYLNHPDGYGVGDFRIVKLIYPEFRRTKYSRYAGSDLLHMLFVSGIANRCYVYQKSRRNENINFMSFYSGCAGDPPCSIPKFETDGPEVELYISIKKVYPTDLGYSVVLYDLDGNIYKSMDLKKYMMTHPGRTEEVADRWLREMNEAASLIKDRLCNH